MAAPAKSRLTGFMVPLFIALTLAKAMYSLWRIITTSAPDFAYYYQASQEAAQKINQPIHLLPPASLLLYAPLHYIPYGIAQGAWVILSFFSLIAIVVMISRSVGIKQTRTVALISALSYLSFPTQFTLGMGQVNLIALALVVAAVFIEGQKRSMLAGVVMAVAWLLKPELLLLFPVLVICRRWRLVAAVVGTLGVAVLASILLWGTDAYSAYAARLAPLSRGFTDAGIYYNQSVTGLLVRAGFSFPWMSITASLILLAVTAWILWKRRAPLPESMWMYMPALVLIEPIAWQHHFVLLIPAFIILWMRSRSVLKKSLIVLSYFLISWNFASSQFLDTIPFGWLLGSHGTIGALIVWSMTL